MHKILKVSAVTLVAFFAGAAFAADDMDYMKKPDKDAPKEHVKKWCHHWKEVVEKKSDKDEGYVKVKEEYEHRCHKHEGKEDDDRDDMKKKDGDDMKKQ
jgi:hypothetical protein